jgi:uncharacterized protein YndB with AHSA1/START domain
VTTRSPRSGSVAPAKLPTRPSGRALADIEQRITIEAGIDRVWEVLADPVRVAAWLGCLEYRGEVGSLFYMQPAAGKRAAGDVAGATHCELLEVTPPTRIRFSWFLPGTPKTTVALTLAARGDNAAAVTLSHTGWGQFDAGDVRAIHEQLTVGWRDFVLPGLAQAVRGIG